ncbi:adenine specific DNA methyltransferase [Candidatus Moduliflexus flocculans]|uniref:site-specific DNA-methyltransferase (adenine-specific) n=1 Tax=Candidatus Moduliflexus flocculans TaxID=1499966 RepID=A0A081BR39_9BACT|nr:adenine specific DNA methyltransferase [Candidatus Moduliflexus flocculans]
MNTPFQQLCLMYLTELREARQHALATDELSLRPALDRFLKAVAEQIGRPVVFLSEAKKIASGRPDFTATVNGLPIGYVEAEAYDVDLKKLTGHAKEQNDRFHANLDNFLLTNHLKFILYVSGKEAGDATLPAPPQHGKISVSSDQAEVLSTLLTQFMQGKWASIASPKELAAHLARRARQIRNEVAAVLRDPATKNGEVYEHYEAVKATLLPEIREEEFAGLYAQTIAYGLFAARCMTLSGATFTRDAAAKLIPKTNPFLRKLFQRIATNDLDDRIAWIADDTAQLLAQAQMAEILAEFGKQTGREDPVVHFYETFLAEYDPTVRETRGVYYTPEPVVSYIARSLDALLKTRFNKPKGLADEKTLILDPATGTGSFLFEVVRLIHQTVTSTMGLGAWSDYVEHRLLPRLFGFELLMAPYAVAHLKLGLLLQQLHYSFQETQRLGIYLTNTLDDAVLKSEALGLTKFIVEEADTAATIKKERPILIVLGNPPYSTHSANRSEQQVLIQEGFQYSVKSSGGIGGSHRRAGKLGAKIMLKTFIGKLIEDYKFVDGKPLGEQNSKLLQDDYVKFIRFAQWRIERTGEGIVGFITNHGYLDNPTFRGMRQSLMQTFNEIYVYNLHGNSRKKEIAPDGGKDENVFDIQQGVAIMFCVKQQGNSQPTQVYYADLWGKRLNKNETLAQMDWHSTQWKALQPCSPFYLFVPQNIDLLPEYEQGWKMTEVMPVNSTGVKTHRDHFVMDFDETALKKRIIDFRNLQISDEEIARRYELVDTRDWRLHPKRSSLATNPDWEKYFTKCLYRPFDIRPCYHHEDVIELPRNEIMCNMVGRKNLAFIATRQVTNLDFCHVLCSNLIAEMKTCSHDRGTNFFPLYLYPHGDTKQTKSKILGIVPNFSQDFLSALAERLKLRQERKYGLPEGIAPEDIFHYAYAIFHSPTYRERYAEFLKIDFPRLPLTSDLDLFRDLAAFGRQLVALHLLDAKAVPILQDTISPFPESGTNLVERVRYDEQTQRVFINATQYFDHVPPEAWVFHVGGYQVCEKWLKDRKERKLTIDDIEHYQQIVVALLETIRLMTAIDERITGFPIT